MRTILNPDKTSPVEAIILLTEATGTVHLEDKDDSFIVKKRMGHLDADKRPIGKLDDCLNNNELPDGYKRPIATLAGYLSFTDLPEEMKKETVALVPEIEQKNHEYVYRSRSNGKYSLHSLYAMHGRTYIQDKRSSHFRGKNQHQNRSSKLSWRQRQSDTASHQPAAKLSGSRKPGGAYLDVMSKSQSIPLRVTPSDAADGLSAEFAGLNLGSAKPSSSNSLDNKPQEPSRSPSRPGWRKRA